MNAIKSLALVVILGSLMLAGADASAADAKSYQVTGPVLEVTPTSITVQKGEEKWQLARDKNTKIPADVKVGSKVTVHYQMVATDVEVKEGKAKK